MRENWCLTTSAVVSKWKATEMATAKKTTAISLDMQVGDATFLKIAKMAHANNMTFNEQINKIVQDAIAGMDKPAAPSAPFGFSPRPQA